MTFSSAGVTRGRYVAALLETVRKIPMGWAVFRSAGYLRALTQTVSGLQ